MSIEMRYNACYNEKADETAVWPPLSIVALFWRISYNKTGGKSVMAIKRVLCLVFSIVMIISLFGCSSSPSSSTAAPGSTTTAAPAASTTAASKGTFKIAVASGMTGQFAEYGLGYKNATQMAVDEWNKKGGVLGKQVEVVVYDDKSTSDEAAAVAQRICADKDIMAVMGHFSSGISMTAGAIYNENKMMQIDSSGSHMQLTDGRPWVFQNNNRTFVEGYAALDIAINEHKGKVIGRIYTETDWGISANKVVEEYFKEKYANSGVKLLDAEFVLTNQDDYSVPITKMINQKADVVIVGGEYTFSAPVTKQYRQLNPNIKFTGYSNLYSQYLLDLAAASVEGTIFPISFYPGSERPIVKNFMDKYKELYKTAPTSYAAQCYDGVNMLFEVIGKVGSLDREKIRDAFAKATYEGVAGKIEFDADRHCTRNPVRLIIKDKKFVEYK